MAGLAMTISLNEHLLSLNADVLKGWLRRVGALDKTAMRKDQLIRAIEQHLTLHLSAVLAQLSPAEKNLLADSAHQGRLLSAREFSARHGAVCPLPPRSYGWRAGVSLLAPFIHHGDRYDLEPAGLIGSLVEPLRTLLPKPGPVTAQTVAQVPSAWPSERQVQGGDPIRPVHIFASERIAPVELSRVLRLIQGGKVKVTDATHRPTEATIRLINEALVVPDFSLKVPESHRRNEWERKFYTAAGPVRAHAWPVLVQQCGWAKARSGTLTLTEAGREIMQQFTPEAFRRGVTRAFGDPDFDELNRINHIRGQSGKGKRWLSDPALRKESIGEGLAAFPIGQWLSFTEAQRLVEASPLHCDVLETDRPAIYFFEPQFGFITDNTGLGRQYLRAFCMETLATLGVLDVAFVYPHRLWPDLRDSLGGDLPFCSRYDGLLFVRLNPLGACALGLTEHYELCQENQPKLFQVRPNLDLVLTGDALNPADRAWLELLAVPRDATTWTLDMGRMLTHVEAGGALAELRAFLEANATDALPASVASLFDELENKLRACRGRRAAVLLEWADESLARWLATDAGFNKLCFHAGENRVVVPAEHLAAFGRAVKRFGFVLPPAK
jgi:hypothetical protein